MAIDVRKLVSFDPFWDALDKVEAEGLLRECPHCHEQPDDVKFALHSRPWDVTVQCNDCKSEDRCTIETVELLIRRWYRPPSRNFGVDSRG